MMRWRCHRYQPLLVDCADGVLAGAQQDLLNRHIGRCVRCANDLAALRELPAALQEYTFPDPGEEFWRRQRQDISRAVRNLRVRRSGGQLAWLREVWRRPAARLPIAAAASLLIALSVYRIADRAQAPPIVAAPHVAGLDADALGALHDMMQAVTPSDDFIPPLADDDDAVLAAVPLNDLVAGHSAPPVPGLTDLNDSELDGVDDLVGDVG